MRVVLRPLNVNNWAGMIRYPNCTHRIGSYITRSGRRYTGLSEYDTERLSKLIGQDLKPESPFWDTYHLQLGATDLVIDTELGPDKELDYLFASGGHKRIKKSLRERKATAEYVLIQEEAEAAEENRRNRVKRQAYLELDSMSSVEIKKALRLLGYGSDTVSSEVAESTITKVIEDSPQKFIDIWVNNKDREVQFLIEDAVINNILRKVKTTYKYGTDVIGYTLDDAILYLKNPAHQDVKSAILTQLNAKKSVFSIPINIEQEKEKVDEAIKKATKTISKDKKE